MPAANRRNLSENSSDMARHNSRKFNRILPSQVAEAPAQPPVTRAAVPEAKDVKRRHAFTARPDDARFVSWHDHEQARTNLAIEKAVATENFWKRK